MQVVICQHDIEDADPAANCARVAALLDGQTIGPGAMIVLCEMFATGYTKNIDTMHDDVEGQPARTFLANLARQYRSTVVAGVVTLASDDRGRNLSVTFSPEGECIATYQKIHPFTFSGEHEYFEPGDAMTSFQFGEFEVCPVVCYDLRFPELFRKGVRHGAHVFTVIASWPSARVDHWVTLNRARAIENQCYVIAINRCGRDKRNEFPGRSMIIDPRGEVLADCGDKECVQTATLDMQSLRDYRKSFPALDDMRDSLIET